MARPAKASGALDRMEIELAGPDVGDMARAFHRQLGALHGPIDVEAIAYELDIREIREAPLDNIEGALLTTPEKTAGSILVNRRSNRRRRRFTIAHELCHLLHAHHKPLADEGFVCSSTDIRVGRYSLKPGMTRHERQERQANRFAIEMLVPEHLLTPYLEEHPGIEAVLEIASAFDISREAAARHFIEKSDWPIAMVFSLDGRVRYSVRGAEFPRLALSPGDPLILTLDEEGDPGPVEVADPADWLHRPGDAVLTSQTLSQQGGYAMTLLTMEEAEDLPPSPVFR